jgi:hypothetical protein
MKIQAADYIETSVNFYQKTWRRIPKTHTHNSEHLNLSTTYFSYLVYFSLNGGDKEMT